MQNSQESVHKMRMDTKLNRGKKFIINICKNHQIETYNDAELPQTGNCHTGVKQRKRTIKEQKADHKKMLRSRGDAKDGLLVTQMEQKLIKRSKIYAK